MEPRKEELKSVIVQVNTETVADQPRWHAVEHAPQDKAATRGHQNASLLIVGRPSLGQLLEARALDLDALAVAGVAPPNHLVNKAPIGGEICEVAVVLRNLYYLSFRKSLSFREKRMFDRARQLVVSEIATVKQSKLADTEVEVDQMLDETYTRTVEALVPTEG